MRFASAGFDSGVVYGTSLDFGYARRDADHHARFWHDREALVHFADAVMQHQLGNVEIADDAVFEGSNRDNIGGRASYIAFGISAYGQGPPRLGLVRLLRGLGDDVGFGAH